MWGKLFVVFYTVARPDKMQAIDIEFCDRYLGKQDVWDRTDINPSLTLAI